MAPQTNQEQWFIDLEVGAQAEVRIFRRILLGVDLRLAIPLTRGRVAYSASGVQHEAWKTWPLATTGFLHGGYTFW